MMKILVVDDEVVSREKLSKSLQNLGHQTHIAANGIEALAALRKEEFDLIFSDILMPGMDGFKFCQECKCTQAFRSIPFVFCTATYTDKKDEEFALKIGAAKLLHKPVTKAILVQTIDGLTPANHLRKRYDIQEEFAAEKEILKLYNERLINKLEKKMLDLKNEVFERQRVEQALQQAKDSLEQLIEQRTAELVTSNSQLEQEFTERKQIERSLVQSESKFRLLFESARDAIAITDRRGVISEFNPATLDLFGYSRAEFSRINFGKLYLNPSDAKRFQQKVEAKGAVKDYEVKLLKKDGTHMDCLFTVTLLLDDNQKITGYQGIIRDVTLLKQAEAALKKSEKRYHDLSITDPLTTLFNLRHFNEQLLREIERADRYNHPLSLLLLDVDNFKNYNDTFGHTEGDQVLIRLGQIIRTSLRNTDSAYRYGGEEFTVILPETQNEEAITVAERIRQNFKNEPFFPETKAPVSLTISIGVAEHTPDEKPIALVTRADKAMYQAKHAGKDRVILQN